MGLMDYLMNDTNQVRLAGLGSMLMQMDQGQTPDMSWIKSVQGMEQDQAFKNQLQNDPMMAKFSAEERSFLTTLPPQLAQKMIAERVFATPDPTTYGWQTMQDGSLIRTDSQGGFQQMGTFAKPQTPDTTSDQKNYQFYAQQEQEAGRPPLSFNEWDLQSRKAGASNITVGGDGAPGLGKLSTDYGYVLGGDGKPKIDQATGLPMAAPIPGSPAAIELKAAGDKTQQRDQNAANAAHIVLQDIDKAVGQVSRWSAGEGSWLTKWPGSDAKDLESSLNTIKANIGFDRLQQMREASPTGGALGGIAVQELTMLQAVLGSLDQAQSPEQLEANLKRLKTVYEPIARKAAAYPNAAEFGFNMESAGPVTGQGGAIQVGAVEGGYRFKGGDPSDQNSWEKVN